MSDKGVIDLRGDDDSPFTVTAVDDELAETLGSIEDAMERSSDMVKVKFDKFVSLVANHDFEEVIYKHRGEDLIIRANLLTDLASVTQERADRKVPGIFILGIVLGIALTWILIKT